MCTMSDYVRTRKITPIEAFFNGWAASHGEEPYPKEIWGQIHNYYKHGTLTPYMLQFLSTQRLLLH